MSKLIQYRTELIAGAVITLLLLVIGSLVGQGILKSERDAYERGARAVIIHTRCRGQLPSLAYLQRAFRWGEPHSCEDVQRIETSDPGS
jgi:hypothetical protein